MSRASVETGPDLVRWFADGACREYPTDWWFSHNHALIQRANAICGVCPVQSECRAYAVERPAMLGNWAGTSPGERALARNRLAS